MPERERQFFQDLDRSDAENGKINIVLGKALSVLPETELFEPVRNLLHRRPSTDLTLSVLDRHVVGVYQPSPRSSTWAAPVRAHTEQGIVADLCTLEVAGDRGAESRNVRFGSKADICGAKCHVCFTPDSDHESGHVPIVMSALPPQADRCSAVADVRFGTLMDTASPIRSLRRREREAMVAR